MNEVHEWKINKLGGGWELLHNRAIVQTTRQGSSSILKSLCPSLPLHQIHKICCTCCHVVRRKNGPGSTLFCFFPGSFHSCLLKGWTALSILSVDSSVALTIRSFPQLLCVLKFPILKQASFCPTSHSCSRWPHYYSSQKNFSEEWLQTVNSRLSFF